MDEKQKKKTSKFLSLVLRHQPEVASVTLDAAGWVGVEELLLGCAEAGRRLTRADLREVVATNPKQRFAFSDDGTRIRANQGHSVDVELDYESSEPPDVLYHGTFRKALDAIYADGLQRMQRHHVHLCADKVTAVSVGARRGRPVLLEIDARAMHAAGHDFFCSTNGVWLTESVPPQYLAQLHD